MEMLDIKRPDVHTLLRFGNSSELASHLNKMLIGDIIDLINEEDEENKAIIFNCLSLPLAIKTFKLVELNEQKHLIKSIPEEKAAQVLNDLPADDRTAFFEELPSPVVKELLKLLSNEERTITLSLLGYPEHSVGRLMSPDYIAVKEDWTIQQVLDFVRENGHDSETVNVLYVIDDQGKLIDDLRIREVLFVSPDKRVSDIMDNRFIALAVTDDEEEAIGAFKNNNRFALPVIDAEEILIGIVTIDDVLRLAEEEGTEDMQKIGGVQALEEPYMNVPFLKLMQKRAGWLVVLFLGEMLTATAMSFFEDEIAKAVILALFIPLIISSGGNSGSQASTLIIRAMALGEVSLKDWWRIMRREIFSGLFLGMILGSIGFFRIAAWTLFTDLYGVHWILVAFTIFFSLIGVVLWGTLCGSMLPLFLKKLGTDPAVSSAPFVATLVDVTGLLIYFSIAVLFFRGTLL
ncbi:MAG: magnesium transporter [Chitinophagales bacterium]|nr:magnesium transporter [Chitinophagales bacterium]